MYESASFVTMSTSVGSQNGEEMDSGNPSRIGEEDGVWVTDWETVQGLWTGVSEVYEQEQKGK